MNIYWIQVDMPWEPIARTLIVDAPNAVAASAIVGNILYGVFGRRVIEVNVLEIDPSKLLPNDPMNEINMAAIAKVPRGQLITRDEIVNRYGLTVSNVPPAPGVEQPVIQPKSRH